MAQWTPVYHDAIDKPEMIELAGLLGVSLSEAFGLAVRFWQFCDANCVPDPDADDPKQADGHARRVTPVTVDAYLRCAPGATSVARALETVGWARFDDAGMVCPRFTAHMGGVAKSRMQAAQRQARARAKKNDPPDNVTPGAPRERDDGHAPSATPARPRRDTGHGNVAPKSRAENTTKREETAAASPAGAAPCENPNAEPAAAALVDELTAGEAERDGPLCPDGWPARFAALGLDDPVALAQAGTLSETRRMAYLAERLESEAIRNPGAWLRKAILENWGPPDGWAPRAQRDAEREAQAERRDRERRAAAEEIEREKDDAWAWYEGLETEDRARESAALAARGILPPEGRLPEAPTAEQRSEMLGVFRRWEHREGGRRISSLVRRERDKGALGRRLRPERELPPGRHKRHLERWDEYWALSDEERRALCGEHLDAGDLPEQRPDREPTHDELAIVSTVMFERGQAQLKAARSELRSAS